MVGFWMVWKLSGSRESKDFKDDEKGIGGQ
jgi:hypothetical protein